MPGGADICPQGKDKMDPRALEAKIATKRVVVVNDLV